MNQAVFQQFSMIPEKQGLYDPVEEKDACGLAMVATLNGEPSHHIIDKALTALTNLEHRGAIGADAGTGDGAGILTQIPDAFFREIVDFPLPKAGQYAVGTFFLSQYRQEREQIKRDIARLAREEGLSILGWREVPVVKEVPGHLARKVMPHCEQLFIAQAPRVSRILASGIVLDRIAFRLRKRCERELGCYCVTLSSRTIGYKGMLTTRQLIEFYPDLSDERFTTKLALVHSRYSTNTFPSWPLAHPMRMIAHNGEINTVQGNRNWMKARESQLASPLLGDLKPLLPICTPGASDSASFDEVLELLTLSGRSLPHAMMMMVPPSWESQENTPQELQDFYRYNSFLMEEWDGPAAIVFTDGELVGATLDRNGLRPGRFVVTDDGLVLLGSEIGLLDIDPERIVQQGRLQSGRFLLVDTASGRLIEDEEIRAEIAGSRPYGQWIAEHQIELTELPPREHITALPESLLRRQRIFGYTEEEVRLLLAPMAAHGIEPIGAMGTDTPIAVLAERPRLLFDYFVQKFAQVTNPPLDAIREEVVTSLGFNLGPVGNLLEETGEHARQIHLQFPVLTNDELAKIQNFDSRQQTRVIRGLYQIGGGAESLRERLDELCAEADQAIADGCGFIILSDRHSTKDSAPIPSLLMLSAVHHHLIRQGTRMRASLVVEAGDVREIHHVATLIGYGASAVNPYLALETVERMVLNGELPVTSETAMKNLVYALGKGVLKIMSKMGISTISSYAGAQQFEAIGLSEELIETYFTHTTSKLGGVGLETLERENAERHASGYPLNKAVRSDRKLAIGGEYQWRREGPPHLFNPETIFRLQHSTRNDSYEIFQQYTRLVNEQARELKTLRGMFALKTDARESIPLSEVEPVESIVKRFSTGAMSYGSISQEAHETLAIAMNRLGARSNTGEGGEDLERLLDPERRSAIKQIASGRFGVTSMYLTHADDLQIKMAQGAKPGEGGQLPPSKVYPWVAKTRHATAGVGLISPPPHHDIYSIEDLKQLIFDLKRANPSARVHVKLVSQSGVGTVAAGVAKALADVVLISGHDGGTGASPLNSLKHAGTPWEIGLAETQQTLRLNRMRGRIVVQVDGSLKTGRDVIIASLLGAEEYGFATAPLVVSGCVMMRVCHLDTCPVGVATQNPLLRERFSGKAEYVVNFFRFIAEEVREYLAELGYRSLDEIIGRSDLLEVDEAIEHYKAEQLDLSPIFHSGLAADHDQDEPRRNLTKQDHALDAHFDQQLIRLSQAALEHREPVVIELPIRNVDRAVGTMLGHEVTKRFGEPGLARETIDITLHGTAGQSLGAFLPAGIKLRLEGQANDYVGKGLSGGEIVVRPDRRATFRAEEQVIAGNVLGYGATSGKMLIRGIVGERFMVRNSGATAVVEGVGDHALEYMTGGRVIILGPTGRNLAAGMSGGIAYVYQLDRALLNTSSMKSGELTLHGLDRADIELLRDLLVEHEEDTGSTLATELLADFDETITRFTKLVPRDFAEVQAIRERADQDGLEPDVIWKQILEATDGRS